MQAPAARCSNKHQPIIRLPLRLWSDFPTCGGAGSFFPAGGSSVSLFAASAVIIDKSTVLLTIPWEPREPKLPGKCPLPCLQHFKGGSSSLSCCMADSPLLYSMNCQAEAAFNGIAVTGQLFASPASRDISLRGSGEGEAALYCTAAAALLLGLRLPGCTVIPARLFRSPQGCGGARGMPRPGCRRGCCAQGSAGGRR